MPLCLFLFTVWQYVLLQLCVASTLLLSRFSRESVAIQAAAEKPEEGVAANMSGRPVLQHCHSEEKSGHHCTKEVYHQIEEGERLVLIFVSHCGQGFFILVAF